MRRPAARRAVSRVGAVACSNCSEWFGSAGLSSLLGLVVGVWSLDV